MSTQKGQGRITMITLVAFTQKDEAGKEVTTDLAVPITEDGTLPHLDVVNKVVESQKLEEENVPAYLQYLTDLEPDILNQTGARLTDEQLVEARSEAFNTLLLELDGILTVSAAEAATEQPVIETPEPATPEEIASETVVQAAKEGNAAAQEVVTQVEVIANEAGVSVEKAMTAVFGMRSAQKLASRLLKNSVSRQQAFMAATTEELSAIADYLDDSSEEIVAQLQAAPAQTALPAETTA